MKAECYFHSYFLDIKQIIRHRDKYSAPPFVILKIAFLSLFINFYGFSQLPDLFSENKFFINGKPTVSGADAALYPDSPSRLKIDLAGKWKYSLEGESWNNIEIPSAYIYRRTIKFQRQFELTPEIIDKYIFSLVAYGINYQSEITINGNFIGRHVGGYTSFVFHIPDNVLQVGNENVITITVDNTLNAETTLPLESKIGGLRTYGGIFRDIYLLATPRLMIEDLSLSYSIQADKKKAKISVQAEITDRGSEIRAEAGTLLGFQCEVYDKLEGFLVGRSGIAPITPVANKSFSKTTEIILDNPKFWSPARPDLYNLKAQLVRVVNKESTLIDEYSIDFGLRSLEWKSGYLSINDSIITLNGILWNEEHEIYGSALTYEVMEKDIASIVTLGANLIRFRHPPHPYMLNLCDRYGLLVLEDLPLTQVPSEILLREYYQEMAINYTREMVTRDRHHVSVLAWGIGDECGTDNPASCEFFNNLRNIIKSLDKRYVYFSSSILNNKCYEYVDIIGLNSYGEDPKQFKEVINSYKESFSEKPIIVSRYGTVVEHGNKNGYSDPYSMEYQARYAMSFHSSIISSKIAGGVFWSFNDWYSDRAAMTARSQNPYLCTMGIVSSDREKRTGYNYIRGIFKEEKVRALPVGNYSSHIPIIYVIAGFIVLISLAFFYNANRRFRDGINRSLLRTYNFFADVRDQRILPVSYTFFLALLISITWAIIISSILTHYRSNILLDNLISQIFPDVLKEGLISLIWNPPEFILIFSGIIFIFLMLVVLIVKIFSALVKTRVYFYNTFTISIWSFLPSIILIPLSMILTRIMETDIYVIPVFVILGLIKIWIILRLFKGISIIYDVRQIGVYVVGFLFIIFLCASLYVYVDYAHAFSIHVKYMIKTLSQIR